MEALRSAVIASIGEALAVPPAADPLPGSLRMEAGGAPDDAPGARRARGGRPGAGVPAAPAPEGALEERRRILRTLDDAATDATTREELALIDRVSRSAGARGAALANLTEPDQAAAATSIRSFFEAVGKGVIAAQRDLDAESERYSAGSSLGGVAVPTSFRIPQAEAEIHFAMQKRRDRGFDVFIAKSKSSSDLLIENRVKFTVVAAPPPPDVAARLARTRPLLDQLVLDPTERGELAALFRRAAAEPGDPDAQRAVARILPLPPAGDASAIGPEVLLVRQQRARSGTGAPEDSVTAIRASRVQIGASEDAEFDAVRLLLGEPPRLDSAERSSHPGTLPAALRTIAFALVDLADWQKAVADAISPAPDGRR
ncbi:MAG TPA: hypothetical protein PKC43_04625 [Phycisphaerales bacterium]|nr:hypothetical protein [Phycisphaerales bacterium]HMP36712.1 hypothetical protein [Phycisphaerales bacterium]